MKFQNTKLSGCFLIDLELNQDERGFFARSYCEDEFLKRGLQTSWVQMSNSLSLRAGTLRGLHLQHPPRAEVKMVRCISGKIWDVIVDLRRDSETFGQWFGVILSAQNRKIVYIDKGVAHGFVAMEDNSEIIYSMSEKYSKQCELTIKWDDPKIKVNWPIIPKIISQKDLAGVTFDTAVGVLQKNYS